MKSLLMHGGHERLADSVEFRMVDERWIWYRRMLEREPLKGFRERQRVNRIIESRVSASA